MKRNLLKSVLLASALLLITSFDSFAQRECYNTAWSIDPPNDVGIHTENPEKPLHIFGRSECPDPALRLSYSDQPDFGGHLALKTDGNDPYSSLATTKDLILQADPAAEDLILTTRSNLGSIRFATTETENDPDIERMTILPIGHVGIFETDPREALQIGPLWTFHIGANDNFLGYNEFVTAGAQRKRILPGFASCLNFSNNGIVYLGSAGDGAEGSEVSYDEAEGGFKGIMLGNFYDKGHIGIGSYLMEHNRLIIRGMGNTDATYAIRIINSDMATSFIVRDDGNVGIGNTSPSSRLVVRGMGNDAQSSSLEVKNSDNSSLLFVRDDGNIGIGNTSPSSRLEVRGAGNTDQSTALDIVDSDGTSLLSVRDDGQVSISGDIELDGKLMLGTRRVKGPVDPSEYYDNYLLSVDGTIITTELVISDKDIDWADFVFNDSYNLIPLNELEQSIKKNKHLPGIPTAEEVSKKGFKVGEMQCKLLQKIEEMTLYIIELKKENDSLREEVDYIIQITTNN